VFEERIEGEPARPALPGEAAASFVGALEGAFAHLRGELLAEIADLRQQLELQQGEDEARDLGYMTIGEFCERFRVSRSTSYRMLNDQRLGLEELVMRVPPEGGDIRLPIAEVDELFRAKQAKRKRRARNA
jgi:excisionase family DNA binding protein